MKGNSMDLGVPDTDSDSYRWKMSRKLFLIYFLIIISLSTLMRAYYLLRYNFLVLDGDSISITKTILSIELSDSIHPTIGYVYSNGFGYQLYSLTGSFLTGIPVVYYQLCIRPLLGTIVVFVSYLFYSAYFKERRIVLLSMVLLLVSPITLFETTRASHMVMDISFLLLSFYLLKKYYDDNSMWWLLLLLPVLICMDLTNIFMALIINIGLAVTVLIRSYSKCYSPSKSIPIKIKNITLNPIIFIIFMLLFAISIYVHPIMFNSGVYIFDTVLSVTSSISSMTAPIAYTYVAEAWKSPLLYWTFIILYNVTILPLSLFLFIYMLYYYFVKRCPISAVEMTVMSVFGIWGLLVVAAIFVDFIGAGGIGSNLQLRITTLIIPFTILLIGYSITSNRPSLISTLFSSKYVVIILGIFMIGSLLYITADPLVSNSWRYSSNYEKDALFWLEDRLDQPTMIWEGDAFVTGSRLSGVYSLFKPIQSEKKLDFVTISMNPKYYLDSTIISKHYSDLNLSMPYFQKSNLIYANGDGKLFGQL